MGIKGFGGLGFGFRGLLRFGLKGFWVLGFRGLGFWGLGVRGLGVRGWGLGFRVCLSLSRKVTTKPNIPAPKTNKPEYNLSIPQILGIQVYGSGF